MKSLSIRLSSEYHREVWDSFEPELSLISEPEEEKKQPEEPEEERKYSEDRNQRSIISIFSFQNLNGQPDISNEASSVYEGIKKVL